MTRHKTMDGNSILVLNRDHSLPPLLLPSLASQSTLSSEFHFNRYAEPRSSLAINTLHGSMQNVTGLDKLATIAINATTHTPGITRTPSLTPPPFGSSAEVDSNMKPAAQDTVVLASLKHTTSKIAIPSPSPSPPLSYGDASSMENLHTRSKHSSTSFKRQRIGPSCDNCRSKKIKCSASIEILIQDNSIIKLYSEHLHHIFTKSEIDSLLDSRNSIQDNLNIPKSLFSDDSQSGPMLIKHLDKIILFSPCTSCMKKKHIYKSEVDTCNCTFSKGFTRGDINVFSKIFKKLNATESNTKNSINDVLVTDYELIGI